MKTKLVGEQYHLWALDASSPKNEHTYLFKLRQKPSFVMTMEILII